MRGDTTELAAFAGGAGIGTPDNSLTPPWVATTDIGLGAFRASAGTFSDWALGEVVLLSVPLAWNDSAINTLCVALQDFLEANT